MGHQREGAGLVRLVFDGDVDTGRVVRDIAQRRDVQSIRSTTTNSIASSPKG